MLLLSKGLLRESAAKSRNRAVSCSGAGSGAKQRAAGRPPGAYVRKPPSALASPKPLKKGELRSRVPSTTWPTRLGKDRAYRKVQKRG